MKFENDELKGIMLIRKFDNEKQAIRVCETIKELVAEINSDTDADLGGIVRVM